MPRLYSAIEMRSNLAAFALAIGLGIFVCAAFWSVYSEISYRPGLALVEEVRSGFSPVSWSQTREDLVKDRISSLPNSCLWAHNEIRTTLSLMLLDRTFSMSSNFRGKSAALRDNLAFSKQAIACTPLRHLLWLRLLRLHSILSFDKNEVEHLITFTHGLSPIQSSDREARIATYFKMLNSSELLQMKPVQDDLVYLVRFDRGKDALQLLRAFPDWSFLLDFVASRLTPEEIAWLQKISSLTPAAER